jgi:hypothetical protein
VRRGYGLDITPAGGWGRPDVDLLEAVGAEAAGADWWHEYVPPRIGLAEARKRILSGPIRP